MRKFEHEVVVYVWRFVGMRVGHASLKIKSPGLSNPMAAGKDHCYVSWWPKGDTNGDESRFGWRSGVQHRTYNDDRRSELKPRTRESLASGKFQPIGKQKYANTSYLPETYRHKPIGSVPEGWGTSADAKVRLPGLGNDDVVFGLDIGAMVRWWHLFTSTNYEDQFNLLKLNCSRVTAMCLLAGGAGRICKPPSRTLNIWTPNTILAWTQKIEAALEQRNEAVRRIGVTKLPKGEKDSINLLAPDAWKARTTLGPLSRRRDQVLAIDDYLTKLSRLGRPSTEAALKDAMELLDAVLGQVHSHICKKGDVSKNREAIAQLGQQALTAYRTHSASLAELMRHRAQDMKPVSRRQLLDQVNPFEVEANKL